MKQPHDINAPIEPDPAAADLKRILGDLKIAPVKPVGAIRVAARPVDDLPAGRGFIDVSAEAVEFHIVPHRPYASFAEGDEVRFDLDDQGELVYVEVSGTGGSRPPMPAPSPPTVSAPIAALRFLDRPSRFDACTIVQSTPAKGNGANPNPFLYINLQDRIGASAGRSRRYYRHAEHLIFGVAADSTLAEMWLCDLSLDSEGRRARRWRGRTWRRARQLTSRSLLPVSCGEEGRSDEPESGLHSVQSGQISLTRRSRKKN